MTACARWPSVRRVNDEPTLSFSDADLELLLVEADREDPFLRDGRPGSPEGPREALNELILAGLVSP